MGDNTKGDNFGLPPGLTPGLLNAVKSLSDGGSAFVNFVKPRVSDKQKDRDADLTMLVQATVAEANDLAQKLITLKERLQKK